MHIGNQLPQLKLAQVANKIWRLTQTLIVHNLVSVSELARIHQLHIATLKPTMAYCVLPTNVILEGLQLHPVHFFIHIQITNHLDCLISLYHAVNGITDLSIQYIKVGLDPRLVGLVIQSLAVSFLGWAREEGKVRGGSGSVGAGGGVRRGHIQ